MRTREKIKKDVERYRNDRHTSWRVDEVIETNYLILEVLLDIRDNTAPMTARGEARDDFTLPSYIKK